MDTGGMMRCFLMLVVLQIWNCPFVDSRADPRESVKLRLVNGSSPCAGRLEVHYKERWGVVHDKLWDLPDAAVVCRELGCGAAVAALGGAHFGRGPGPVMTGKVRCNGSEAALRDCRSVSWGPYSNEYTNDAGVICSDHRDVRLISGDDQCSGRLEIQFGATWGTVCDQHWNMDDASVVCGQLQCGVAVSVPRMAYFGEGTGLIHSDVFGCKGNETSLWDCPLSTGTHHCNHSNDVSVVCSGNHGPRLVGGANRCSGRLEILHGAQWGTVCRSYFSVNDANVVCAHLQCGIATATPEDAHFGEETGRVWKEKYSCRGNESRLTDCPVSSLDQVSCSHGNDASVVCSDDSWSLRLVNGGSNCDGRVELYHNGRWGRVQDNAWNINDSNVVCRDLGCGVAISAYKSSRCEESEQPVWVNNVQCDGNESQLRNCTTFKLNRVAIDSTDVGVLCADHLQLRLAGGRRACAGRLEVYYRGAWGTVCDDTWHSINANVSCKQLGCGYALKDKAAATYGRSHGPIWLDEVRCSGNESYLWDCPSAPWGEHDCRHKEDVTLMCSEHKDMRLVNGKRRCEGRVEVLYNGTWGTVCSEKMDEKDAEVVCKQMECGTLETIYHGAWTFGEGTGPIWLDEMECSSHESTLWQCQSDPWGKHNCNHGEDAGVACKEASISRIPCVKACDGENEDHPRRLTELPLRLIGGSNNCSGWVAILFNNSWGTVCDDSWDLADDNVVCRQLDCGSARWSSAAATIAPASGDIWLDEVKCTGGETFLSSCRSSPLGEHDCDHKEDVFVDCTGPILTPTGSTISGLGKKISNIVIACIVLGIVLIGELFTLMIITRRMSARRANAAMSGGYLPSAYYQHIYEEIENTLPSNNITRTQESDSSSTDYIHQIEYYPIVLPDYALLGTKFREGNPSGVPGTINSMSTLPSSKANQEVVKRTPPSSEDVNTLELPTR